MQAVAGACTAFLRVGPATVLFFIVRVPHAAELWLSLVGSLEVVLAVLSTLRLSCRSTMDRLLFPLEICMSGSFASE